jgi:DNA-binding GntR family transcriptional regulator
MKIPTELSSLPVQVLRRMRSDEKLRHRVHLTVDPSKSIADKIYESLKDAITFGEIELGQRLFELEVAKVFHASRTPVREASRRLEQDCFAERLPQGGIRVAQVNEETVKDLFDLRVLLEAHAVELACVRINQEEIGYLKQIRAQADELLKSSYMSQEFVFRRFIELCSMLHDTIYKASRSCFLINITSNIRLILVSVRSMSVRLDSINLVWDEHSQLIGHIEKGDKRAAVRLIKQHVYSTGEQVLPFIWSKQIKKRSEI